MLCHVVLKLFAFFLNLMCFVCYCTLLQSKTTTETTHVDGVVVSQSKTQKNIFQCFMNNGVALFNHTEIRELVVITTIHYQSEGVS